MVRRKNKFLTNKRNNKIKIIDNNTIPVLPQGKNHKNNTPIGPNGKIDQPKTVPTQKYPGWVLTQK